MARLKYYYDVKLRSLSYIFILWHVEPLLGNDGEISNSITAVAKNKHFCMATIALQQGNGVFYAVRAEML
jgi:hypothetical protein